MDADKRRIIVRPIRHRPEAAEPDPKRELVHNPSLCKSSPEEDDPHLLPRLFLDAPSKDKNGVELFISGDPELASAVRKRAHQEGCTPARALYLMRQEEGELPPPDTHPVRAKAETIKINAKRRVNARDVSIFRRKKGHD